MKKNIIPLIMLLLIFPFITPEFLLKIGSISSIVKVWKIVAGIFAIALLFKKRKINKILLILTLFYVIMIISAIINNNNVLDFLNGISFLWIISFFTDTKEKYEKFCTVYKVIMTIYVTINLFTMIVYPNGLYSTSAYELNWFLGYKNTLIRRILPYVIIILLNSSDRKMKLYEKFGILFAIASIILSKSFNGYIGMVTFILPFFLLQKFKKLSSKLSFSKIFLVYVVLDIVMLNTNILANFDNFIVNVLEKNGSMLGRSAIWSRTSSLIWNSPFIGYGGISPTYYSLTFNVSHPHNLLLYYLMLGGVASVCTLFTSFKVIDNSILTNHKVKTIIMCFYISMLSMGFLESLIGAIFFIPFISMFYNINKGGYYDRDLHTVSN